jgi:hypothetical protein
VGRSDVLVGKSDATPGYPVGKSDRELLVQYKTFQIVLSLYPTVFSLDDKNCGRHRQREKLLKKRPM